MPTPQRFPIGSGGLTTFARFQVMHGQQAGPVSESQRRVLDDLHERYDMKHHTQVSSPQKRSLTSELIDEYAIAGPATHCVGRLRELAAISQEQLVGLHRERP